MTHEFDIDPVDRHELATVQAAYCGIHKANGLFELVRQAYPLAANKLIDPDYYSPTVETDEVEAAIFIHAWFISSRKLLNRFGQDGALALFERFRPFLPTDPDIAAKRRIALFRGDTSLQTPNYEDQFSWTTKRGWAEKFAWSKPGHAPVLVTGSVAPKDVLVALPQDGESEVIVRPGTVQIESVTSLLNGV